MPDARLAEMLDAASVETVRDDDPCALPKARKTEAELDGAREAHLRDGAATCRFLAWLDRRQPGAFTEIGAVRALERVRRETNALRDISFDTIAGSGPNGAIVHYRVTEGTDRSVSPRSPPDRQRRTVPGRHHRRHPAPSRSAPRRTTRSPSSPAFSGA